MVNKHEISNHLKEKLPGLKVCCDEPMRLHTSFKIGGNADVFVMPSSVGEIVSTVSLMKSCSVPVTVIGNGSNILVSDEGIEGVVVCIGKEFADVDCKENIITASAGALLSRIANVALENSLAGFEFASGIPGSLGGAIVMNAGAYDGEMKDVVVSTTYMTSEGELKECVGDEHLFGYRKSCFKQGDIILSSTLQLTKGSSEDIRAKMRDLNNRRKSKQPLEYPSAGSAFKRPEGYFAAKLIDDAGLKGYRVGDAAVSEKHCGFIVNLGNATAADVRGVIAHVQQTVLRKYAVELEPEIRMLGR